MQKLIILIKECRWIFLIACVLQACSPYKQLDKDEYLLNKNVVKIDQPELKEGVKAILKQKANRRILGLFRFHLSVYSLGNQGKPTKFKNWLKNTVGEEPVILDTLLTQKSKIQIRQYMANNGYFNAEVVDSVSYRKKKAKVTYYIKSNIPYTIQEIVRESADDNLDSLVKLDTLGTSLVRGKIYKTEDLTKDRERITNKLRNKGYYFFSQQFITYQLDSSHGNFTLTVFQDVMKNVQQDPYTKEILSNEDHKVYTLQNIYVSTDYDPLLKDTVKMEYDTIAYNDYLFLVPVGKRNFIKPDAIVRHSYLRKGDLYRQDISDQTYRSLNLMGVFRFINMSYAIADSGSNRLATFINLAHYKRQDYKLEGEGTNNGGNLGVAGDVSYRNKNLFRGGELLEFKLRGALESQKNFSGTSADNKILVFNTYEAGVENSLTLPKAIRPFTKLFKEKSANPQTIFSVNYNLQNRPEFNRTILDFATSLDWRKGRFVKQTFTPFQINFVNVKLDKQFEANLLALNDPILLSSYDNHLITNGRYSFLYNNQELNKLKNSVLFRLNIEFAGNSLRILRQWQHATKDNQGRYAILNKPFAQYLRPDADIRFYHPFSAHSMLVYRLTGGIGITYGNSVILPFEKSFYAGGSNDLRAFRARSVGPGTYSSANNFELTGDIKLNSNLEYRFDILRVLKGAFFVDAGNIWLRKKDESRLNAEFDITKFYRQLAVGSGVGFRFDFTFFIFRLDIGVPIVDPHYPVARKWVISRFGLTDLNFNFGIGYPF